MTDPQPPTASNEHTAPADPTADVATPEPTADAATAEDLATAQSAERTVDPAAPAEDIATTDPADDVATAESAERTVDTAAPAEHVATDATDDAADATDDAVDATDDAADADGETASFVDSGADEPEDGDAPTPSDAADESSADPGPGSGTVPVGFGENYPPESGSEPPQTELGDEASGDVLDEEHLAPGQTEVPVGDEVVIDDETMRRAIEAILMVTDEPLPVLTLARAVGRPTGDVAEALGTLADEYTEQGRGFDLREVGGGWRYYTRVDAAPYVERFVLDGQQARLTQAALETLAVVAYKQPVSRARVSAIRGVNVDGVMRTLIARGLVEEAGADTESQAILYRTTSYFLERMGMQSLDDLPELAPYLPDMDDIEDELAAQTIPSAAPEDPTPTENATPPDPPAEPNQPDGANEPTEANAAADEPTSDEPTSDEPIDAAENSDADEYGEDRPTEPTEDEPTEDVPGEDETGVDGDLTTGEPVELDVEHEPGELEPSEEVGPADGEYSVSGDRRHDG